MRSLYIIFHGLYVVMNKLTSCITSLSYPTSPDLLQVFDGQHEQLNITDSWVEEKVKQVITTG